MLCFNLKPIFKVRGIDNPIRFLVKAGFNYHAAHALMEGIPRKYQLEHVERLCGVLVCEPNDLMLWKPDANEPNPDAHGLAGLRAMAADEGPEDVHATLRKTPYKELKAMRMQQDGAEG